MPVRGDPVGGAQVEPERCGQGVAVIQPGPVGPVRRQAGLAQPQCRVAVVQHRQGLSQCEGARERFRVTLGFRCRGTPHHTHPDAYNGNHPGGYDPGCEKQEAHWVLSVVVAGGQPSVRHPVSSAGFPGETC